jgi:hypothetical protein
MNVLTLWSTQMQLETKFLRLRTPVTLGSRFGDWHVTWLGGWSTYRLYYLVMVVRLQPAHARAVTRRPSAAAVSFIRNRLHSACPKP